MREVYARANISPEATGFIEAHGTGTKTGDPIEARAIYRALALGSGRSEQSPLYMGSVKTNVGHLESASGIISIIKVSLMLERGLILPNVNFEKANDEIPLHDWNINVPTSIQPWPKNKRFVSVNNFGFGGSNAHAVLERPPAPLSDLPTEPETHEADPKLFTLSANDEGAVRRMASQLSVYIEKHPDIFDKRPIRDMAYTLGERRTHFPWRVSITASSCNDLANSLKGAEVVPGRAFKLPRLAFVYTGAGAQWPQMGKELMDSHPLFAETMKAAGGHLTHLGADFCLVEELSKSKEESRVNEARISQPLCTAVQLGLTDLLSSWEVMPSVVLGHSSGEIGAAYASGAITLKDAMTLAYHRGRVSSELGTKYPCLRGAMLAVGAGVVEVKRIIKSSSLEKNVTVACENSPNSTTVSGDEDAVDLLANELENRSLFNRKLRVGVAYHSSHMQLVADDYLNAISAVTAKPTTEDVTFYSSLFGNRLDDNPSTSLGPSYWFDNLTKPVLFHSALQELYGDAKPDIVVEVGPHSTLEGPIKQTLKGISQQVASEVKYFPSLVRNQNAALTTLKLAGSLFVNGCGLNFGAINRTTDAQGSGRPVVITDLPSYPWSDHSYWFESRESKQHRLKPFARHDLLGVLEDSYSDVEPTWRNVLSTDDVPWLKDHRMQSLTTFPLAGYFCMVVEAAAQRAQLRGVQSQQIAGFRLRETQISRALMLEYSAQYEMLVSLKPYAEGTRSYSSDWDEFHISSWTSGRGWVEHCHGLVGIRKQSASNPVSNIQLQAAAARREKIMGLAGGELSLERFYTELEGLGAGYRSAFTLHPGSGLKSHGEYATCRVVVPDTAPTMPSSYETPSILPTAFMDLFFQLTFAIFRAGLGQMPSLYMPSAVKEVEISSAVPNQSGEHVQVVAHGCPDFSSPGPVDFCIEGWHASQPEPVVKLAGFRMTPVNGDIVEAQSPRSLCYKVQWEPLDNKPETETENENENAVAANGIDGHQTTEGEDNVAFNCNGDHTTILRSEEHPPKFAGSTETITNGKHTNDNKVKINGEKLPNGRTMQATTVETNGGTETDRTDHTLKDIDIRDKAMIEGNNKIQKAECTNAHAEAGSDTEESHLSNGHIVSSGERGNLSDDAYIVLITDRNESEALVSSLANLIELHTGLMPSVSSFSCLEVSPSTRYICLAELDAPLLYDMSAETFQRVQKLLLTCLSILWVSAGAYRFAETPRNNIAQGLLRTVRSEASRVAATLDLDPNSDIEAADRAKLIFRALKASICSPEHGSPIDYEFAEEQGGLVVPRVVKQEDMNLEVFHQTQPTAPYLQNFEQIGRRLKIAVGTYGALDSLYWKDEVELPLAADEIEIRAVCTGMNFKDVVIAMGQVASPYLGVECSGTVARIGSAVTSLKVGDHVCAMSPGAYSTYARCPATSAAVIPETMSFEVAASIPVVYCTVYYAIVEIARLEPGEKILIHAASGGVGQAAIQLAQMIGGEIYATVGSAAKKQLLIHTYGVPEDHIFYSRDTTFGPALKEASAGGVDVVINSLAGDLLRETWECVAPFGRFVEIGKRDITSNTRLEMAKFEHNCSFSSVDLSLVAAERPKIMIRVLNGVMDLLVKKAIKPIEPITTVGISEVETALRKLQSGKTSGKVVVNHVASGKVNVSNQTCTV